MGGFLFGTRGVAPQIPIVGHYSVSLLAETENIENLNTSRCPTLAYFIIFDQSIFIYHLDEGPSYLYFPFEMESSKINHLLPCKKWREKNKLFFFLIKKRKRNLSFQKIPMLVLFCEGHI